MARRSMLAGAHPAAGPPPAVAGDTDTKPADRPPVEPQPAASREAPMAEGVPSAPLESFAHRPDNPRWEKEYDPAQDPELDKFGETLDTVGILQAVTVTSVDAWLEHHPEHTGKLDTKVKWIVVMGNRRLAIAQHKHLQSLPYLRNDKLAHPRLFRLAGLIENYHRKGLDPIREAAELQSELAATGMSKRALAERIGISHTQINQRLLLLELIPEFQALVSDEVLTVQKALPIARLDTPDDQRRLLELGPPYQIGRLIAPAAEIDDSGKTLSTTHPVTIKRRSTPAEVANTLRTKLPPEILTEVLTLLRQ
jgi:ParB family chromosome partitioning protein